MSTSLPTAVAARLPRLLFEPSCPPAVADDIDRMIATAGGRWPALRPALQTAAALVRTGGVYATPAKAPEMALVRFPAEWHFRAVSPSPTGLACTCDGWPPPAPTGPGDGLYCADILAYLLALYIERPFSPLPYVSAELWQVTLEELRLQMTRATFNQWLLGSFAVPEASTPLSLTVAVRNRYEQEWLTHRLHPLITRTLTAVAGYEVQVCFIVL